MDNVELTDNDLLSLARRLGLVGRLRNMYGPDDLIVISREHPGSNCVFWERDVLPYVRAAIDLFLRESSPTRYAVVKNDVVRSYARRWFGPQEITPDLWST